MEFIKQVPEESRRNVQGMIMDSYGNRQDVAIISLMCALSEKTPEANGETPGGGVVSRHTGANEK